MVITNDMNLQQVINDLESFSDKANEVILEGKAIDNDLLVMLTDHLKAKINKKNTSVKVEKDNFLKRFE